MEREPAPPPVPDPPVPELPRLDDCTRAFVEELESAFDVELSHGEALRCVDADAAVDVLSERFGDVPEGPASEGSIDALRHRVVAAFPGLRECTADLGMPVDLLLPRFARRLAWRRLGRGLGLQLPALVNHPAIPLGGLILIGLWAYLGLRAFSSVMPPFTAVTELQVVSALLTIVAVVGFRPRPRAECSRVADLVRPLLLEPRSTEDAPSSWTRGRVAAVVRFLADDSRPPAPGTVQPARLRSLVLCALLGGVLGHGAWSLGHAVTVVRFQDALRGERDSAEVLSVAGTKLLLRYPPLVDEARRTLREGTERQRLGALGCLLASCLGSETSADEVDEIVCLLGADPSIGVRDRCAQVLGMLVMQGTQLSPGQLDACVAALTRYGGAPSHGHFTLLGAMCQAEPPPIDHLMELALSTGSGRTVLAVDRLCEIGEGERLLDAVLARFAESGYDVDEAPLDVVAWMLRHTELPRDERTAAWSVLTSGDPAAVRDLRDRLVAALATWSATH